ncbi:hypothetical protein FQN54_009652 [Arachnomyces sp. PD_36]|nr:hypothetical protein FQN54_009652 [Arachnomyces sp. PD_36]
MFAAKSTIFIALLALCNFVVAAIPPPACLLAAINQQDKPSDMNAMCGANSKDVQSTIQDICGDDVDAALKAYSKSCSEAGKEVTLIQPSTDDGDSESGSGEITSTNTVGQPTGSATESGASPSETTGAASLNKVGSAAAAVAVVAGFAAAL